MPLRDAYRKLRSLIRRPVWLTAEGADARRLDGEEPIVDEIDEQPLVRESPDRSHVVPPPVEPAATRDEALELLERRVDVVASRADRLERSVETLSPVSVSELPSRADYRAVEERLEANRKRGDELARQLDQLLNAYGLSAEARAEDRETLAMLTTSKARLEERLRDLAEEVADARQASAATAASLADLRDALADREQYQTAALSRRLAGAYTMAIVALLAALMTLALRLVG